MLLNDKYYPRIRLWGIPFGKFSINKECQNNTEYDSNVVNVNTKYQAKEESDLVWYQIILYKQKEDKHLKWIRRKVLKIYTNRKMDK